MLGFHQSWSESEAIRAAADKSPQLLQSQRKREDVLIIHIQTEDKSWLLAGVSGFLSSATCQDTLTLMLEMHLSGLHWLYIKYD